MQITIEIPEDVARQMEAKWGNLRQRTLETLAVEGYRSGVITAGQVRRMLNLSCRYEVDGFLKERGAYLDYTEADLEQDIQVLNKLMPK